MPSRSHMSSWPYAYIPKNATVPMYSRTGIGVSQRWSDCPATGTRVRPLSSVCRYLERVGDHVKDLAEQVIFMVEATDVRHRVVS